MPIKKSKKYFAVKEKDTTFANEIHKTFIKPIKKEHENKRNPKSLSRSNNFSSSYSAI